MLKCIVSMLAVLSASGTIPLTAQASEWGCQVLLCAASSNPSWQGVAACHPPMDKLISAMKQPGFSWPTCPEGGAGKPGFEKYAACPTGWRPAAADNDSDDGFSGLKSRCMRAVNSCKVSRPIADSSGTSRTHSVSEITRVYRDNSACAYAEYSARPLRSQPYYFDIKEESSGQFRRYWFNIYK